MEFILKQFWIMLIIVVIANGIFLKAESRKYIAENPSLKKGYDNYFKGWIFFGNIPWVIMGIGQLTGLTNTTFEYMTPRDMNPMVLIFQASIIMLWCLSFRWIYFKNGAEFIEKHPGLFRKRGFNNNSNVTAREIKFFFPLILLGGIIGLVMSWFSDIP